MIETRPPKVLVLMTTCNGAAWVGDQVRSIAHQRGVEITLVFRDDQSTDATIDEVRKAAGPGLNLVEVVATKPSGSAARNFFSLMLAIEATEYDFVALADHDDIWLPEKLARAAKLLSTNDAVACSAAVRAFWPDGRTRILRQSSAQRSADHFFEGAGQGCTYVMKREFFVAWQAELSQRQTRFQTLHYHDWAIYAFCRATGRRWLFDEQVALEYRQHSDNDTGARGNTAAFRKRIGLIRSGWYGKQVKSVSLLCQAMGESHLATLYLDLLDRSRKSRGARWALAQFTLKHGRRRLIDRLVLSLAALLGYLDAT